MSIDKAKITKIFFRVILILAVMWLINFLVKKFLNYHFDKSITPQDTSMIKSAPGGDDNNATCSIAELRRNST